MSLLKDVKQQETQAKEGQGLAPKAKAPEQSEAQPQKPMSIEAYIKALTKEYDVSRLRAGIAENMFKEQMAMMQLSKLKAGLIEAQAAQMQAQAQPQEGQPEESTWTKEQ